MLRMSWKPVSLLSLAMLVVFVVTAVPVGAQSEKIHLEIYGNYSDSGSEAVAREVLHMYLRKYEELNPHVTITDLGREHSRDKILTMLVSGVVPDLIAMGTSNIMNLYEGGLLPPVPEEFVAKMREYIFPVAIEGNTIRGEVAAIPGQNNITGLFYNRRVLGEAGLPDTPPTTWDELAVAGRLTAQFNPDGTMARPGLQMMNTVHGMHRFASVMLWSMGGDIVDENGQLIIHRGSALQQVLNMVEEWTTSFAALSGGFSRGEVAFRMAFPYNITDVQLNYADHYIQDIGVALMPAGPAGSFAVQYGNSYAVPAGPNQEEVWKLLDWLYFSDAGPEGMSPMSHVFMARGYPPIHRNDVDLMNVHEHAQFFYGFLENLMVARNTETLIEHGITSMNPLGEGVLAMARQEKAPAQIIADMVQAFELQQAEYFASKNK